MPEELVGVRVHLPCRPRGCSQSERSVNCRPRDVPPDEPRDGRRRTYSLYEPSETIALQSSDHCPCVHHAPSTRGASTRWSHAPTATRPSLQPLHTTFSHRHSLSRARCSERRLALNPPMIVTAPPSDCLASHGHGTVSLPSAIMGSRSPPAVATPVHSAR